MKDTCKGLFKSKEEGKDQKYIQSSTTSDQRHHIRKWQNKSNQHTQESHVITDFVTQQQNTLKRWRECVVYGYWISAEFSCAGPFMSTYDTPYTHDATIFFTAKIISHVACDNENVIVDEFFAFTDINTRSCESRVCRETKSTY